MQVDQFRPAVEDCLFTEQKIGQEGTPYSNLTDTVFGPSSRNNPIPIQTDDTLDTECVIITLQERSIDTEISPR